MFKRLLPREEDFFKLFERHAALTVEGAKQFSILVGGGQNTRAMAARIIIESASERMALYELVEMTPEVQDLARSSCGRPIPQWSPPHSPARSLGTSSRGGTASPRASHALIGGLAAFISAVAWWMLR
jgi:hypothetical protein